MTELEDADWALIDRLLRADPMEPTSTRVAEALSSLQRLAAWPETFPTSEQSISIERARPSADARTSFLQTWRSAQPHQSPDHEANLADIRAAWAAASLAGDGSVGLLSMSIGPVQSFIAAARSLRDLWTGSVLLSWLSFQAMRPVIGALGPTAFVFPSLRGNPLVDLWLLEDMGLPAGSVTRPCAEALMVPNLPDRSLAVVPWGPDGAAAHDLARHCEDAAKESLNALAKAVRRAINGTHGQDHDGWDALWSAQVKEMLRVQAVATPLDVDAESLDRYACDRTHGNWPALVDLGGRVLSARRSIRSQGAPETSPKTGAVPKCTLLGTWEQMGGDTLEKVKAFWAAAPEHLEIDGVRIRQGEAFCAPSLVKRFAFPSFLRADLKLKREDTRFPDTATVAAMEWLEKADLDWRVFADRGSWSGQWLHWRTPDQDKDEAPCPDVWDAIHDARRRIDEGPPAYYAVMAADGDRMGDTLRKEGTNPAAHGELSARIGAFAVGDVARIVREHKGVTIYAGGDDVLAVLPARRALACGKSLRDAFRAHVDTGLSVGLAVVHHKADLREALQAARDAEQAAKSAGRDRLSLAVQRRSGEHAMSLLSWADVTWAERLVEAFAEGASDRWAYRLRQLAGPLDGMGLTEAMEAEIRRQIGRAEPDTLGRLAAVSGERDGPESSDAPDKVRAKGAIVAAFRSFQAGRDGQREERTPQSDRPLRDFAILCQAASFLARARD